MIKALRCSTCGAAVSGLGATIKYLRGTQSIGLCTTASYLRQTKSAAARNGLGTTMNYLRRATSSAAGSGITIK
jgi:hypothetical protein